MTHAATIQSVARECLRVDTIDPDVPFALLGLDSLKTIELAAALEDALGCELPAEMLGECRDMRALAARLEQMQARPRATAGGDPFARMFDDAVLPEDVRPQARGEVNTALRDAQAILLTGGTGFVGGALVKELLRSSNARLLCLVRANGEAPDVRLRQRLDALRVDASDARRVDAIDGDLAAARLGMTADIFHALAQRIDAVCHAGAAVNWVFSYGALRATNVTGTLELLRLASLGRATPFHFISSLSACYAHGGPARADESFDALPHLRGVHLGYAQSKVVAEALVRQAGARGLPVRIYRPALISGDSVTGAFNRDDLITALARGCVQMGTAPDLDWKLDCEPVDDVARAVVAASAHPGPVFHFGCERPRHWREFVLWMRMYGYPVRLVSYHAWLRQLDEETRKDLSHPLRALRSFFLDRVPAATALTLPELYEESRRTSAAATFTTAVLASEGIAKRTIDASLLETYFRAFRDAGELPPPQPRPSAPRSAAADDILSTAFLSELLGAPVHQVEVRGTGSDHSIVSELTAWRSGRMTGLFRISTDRGDFVLKAKARDADVIDAGESLAGMVDPALERAYTRWRDRIGLTSSHRREIAIYRQIDRRFTAHAPALLGSISGEHQWVMALEDVRGHDLLDASDRAWPDDALEAVVDGLASLQAVWYAREADLLATPWIGPVQSAASMVEMSDLWLALASHAAGRFSSWAGPDIASLQERLIHTVGTWWRDLETAPRTLIHHDFNPRNVCLRRDGGGRRLCAYDWELATVGAPQRDLAEFLCFALPPDAGADDASVWIARHRTALMRETGAHIDEGDWRRGFAAALGDLLINRLASYALIDRVRRQPFLPRVVRTWRRLHQHFPTERIA